MLDKFVPVPLPGDFIPEPEQAVEPPVFQVLEGIIEIEKGDDYIPERTQYLKRFAELRDMNYTPVTEMVNLLIKDLDCYSRGEVSLDEIKNTCREFPIDLTDEHFPNREVIIPYNHIRNRLLDLYEQEFGDK